MNVPSNRAKVTIKKTKSLFEMTFFSTVHMFTCVCFFKLTKLGASLGPDLIASMNPPAIIDTKMHCCKIKSYNLCLISVVGLAVVTPLKIRPVCKNASRFPAGTESALSVITMSLWESGNHLFGSRVVAQTKIGWLQEINVYPIRTGYHASADTQKYLTQFPRSSKNAPNRRTHALSNLL